MLWSSSWVIKPKIYDPWHGKSENSHLGGCPGWARLALESYFLVRKMCKCGPCGQKVRGFWPLQIGRKFSSFRLLFSPDCGEHRVNRHDLAQIFDVFGQWFQKLGFYRFFYMSIFGLERIGQFGPKFSTRKALPPKIVSVDSAKRKKRSIIVRVAFKT